MHRIIKAALILGVSLAAVGINSLHQQSLIDRRIDAKKRSEPQSDALALPSGEVSAGGVVFNEGSTAAPIGEAGGVVILTGTSVPNGARLTWHLGGLSARHGIRLSRSSNPLPSVNKDESVEAPPGSVSFLWKTAPGRWHFRLCLPKSENIEDGCAVHSNDVMMDVYPAADGTTTVPAVPAPSAETMANWQASGGPMSLTVTARPEGVLLSWVAAPVAGFSRYYVVRSETNPQLTWPTDGFLTAIGDIGFTKYIDQEAEAGVSYYYRICSENTGGSVSCGSPAIGKRS